MDSEAMERDYERISRTWGASLARKVLEAAYLEFRKVRGLLDDAELEQLRAKGREVIRIYHEAKKEGSPGDELLLGYTLNTSVGEIGLIIDHSEGERPPDTLIELPGEHLFVCLVPAAYFQAVKIAEGAIRGYIADRERGRAPLPRSEAEHETDLPPAPKPDC